MDKPSELPPKTAKWKNLGVRFISAVVLVGICFLPLVFGGYAWAALVALLGGRLVWEWVRMADTGCTRLAIILPLAGLLAALYFTAVQALNPVIMALAVTGVLVVLERMRRGGGLWSGLGFLYVAIPCVLIVWLRGAETGFEAPGFLLIAFLIVIVGAADTGAYFGGSYFQGPKMAPKLSPKKTWSGFFSGFVFASLFAAAAGAVLDIGVLKAVILAAPIIIFSVIGDFLESGLKRRLQVKDAGTLLPGHGGLLDRLDSLMMVVVVASIALYLSPSLWLG